jgi:hypothetical protein
MLYIAGDVTGPITPVTQRYESFFFIILFFVFILIYFDGKE